MIINCVWEHNGNDTLLYATNFVGAYTRGESLEIAKTKMPQEIVSYCSWLGMEAAGKTEIVIVGEKRSELTIRDADSDVLFESEQAQLTIEEYETLKTLALKSAKDFLALYESIPDKNAAAAPERKTFYGRVPRTANEMYALTQTAGKIGVYTNSSAHGKGNHQVLDGERQRNGGKRCFVHMTDKDAVHNVIKCLNQHRNHHRY